MKNKDLEKVMRKKRKGGFDSNDRGYSHSFNKKIRRMSPEDFQKYLNKELDLPT